MALPEVVVRARQNTRSSSAEARAEEFDAAYHAHANDLERFVRLHVRDHALAEDLVQETFIRAFRTWSTVDKDRPLGPWLRTIAMRLCIDTWRSTRGGRVISIDAAARWDAMPDEDADPAEKIVASARHNGVGDALDGLSARHRRILLMKDSHGMRYEEIARREGTTLAAIRCSLAVARRRFRERYLATTSERGLNSVLWPVLLPLLKCLRSLKRRSVRLVGALHRVSLVPNSDSIVGSSAVQISSGIVAVAVVLGTFPSSGHLPQRRIDTPGQSSVSADGGSMEFAVPVLSRTAIVKAYRTGAARPEQTYQGAGAVPGSEQTSDDTGTYGSTDTGAIPGSGVPQGPVDPNAPPPVDQSPSTPDGVVDTSTDPQPPAVDPGPVTDPNSNVSGPEDSRIFSFAASSSAGVVFASGRNRECAMQVNCPSVLYRSDDAGRTWSRSDSSGLDGGTVLLPPGYGSSDNRIFSTSPAGVLMVSRDAGRSFAPVTDGASQYQGSAAISPGFDSGDPRILIGASPALAQYADDRHTIEPAPYSALPSNLEPVFATPDLLFAGGKMVDDQGVWRSAVYRCQGPVCGGVTLGGYAGTPKLRLSPTFRTDSTMFAFSRTEVFRSTDGGASFTQLTAAWGKSTIVDLAPIPGGKVFIATRSLHSEPTDGLYVSSDRGSTSTKVGDPLFASGTTTIGFAGSHVFVGLGGGGLACSADYGESWAARC